MKILSLLTLLIAGLIFGSCTSEDENPALSYEFKEQIAQGKINGEDWTFETGRALFIDDPEIEPLYYVHMFSEKESITNICYFEATFNEFAFSVPNEIGMYELNSERKGVLVNEEGGSAFSASTGAIEILSITDTQVFGRVDIRIGIDDIINGNFTLEICQD